MEGQDRGSDEPMSSRGLMRGTSIGRYLVVDELGAGAMGAVYAAYDPELARQVALKIVRPRALATRGQQADRMRLLREAQAMARVSHPNVVAVFDVGVHADIVYLAMEMVRGANLRGWLAVGRPTLRQVLDVFVAAGRGLDAAHRGGLVHRDFKPENVLVQLQTDGPQGERGRPPRVSRVCVTDFGLARAAPTSNDEPPPQSPASSSGMLGVTLTVDGDAIGTPVYMAPEQHDGEPADARSDQFAFCVALYEALYGRRPFTGRDPTALRDAKTQGPPDCPPRALHSKPAKGMRGHVPAWLRAVLRRGLQPDPAARFRGMSALLRRLEGAPRQRRRMAIAGTVATLGLGTSLGLAYVAGVSEDGGVCDDAGALPAETWTDEARDAIVTAFAAAPASHAPRQADTAIAALDAHVRRWTEVHRDVCEATWVRGQQSAELLDVRMSCLRTQWQDVAATVRLLSTPDPQVVQHAISAVGALPDPRACHKLTVAATSSLPHDPDLRRAVARLRAKLADARALQRAGKPAEAARRVERLVTDARDVDHPPLLAEALLLAGEIHEDAGDLEQANAVVQEALSVARGAGDLRAEAEAWIRLAFVHGYDRNDATHGRFCAEMGLAVVERLGGDVPLQSWAHSALGTIAYVGGDDEGAVEHWGRALQLRREALGERHPLVASSLNNLGGALYGRGRFEDAERYLRRALELRTDLLGADHPKTAESHANLGVVLVSQHRGQEALEHLERAFAVQTNSHDASSPAVAQAHDALGSALMQVDRPDEALEHHRAAASIYDKTLGPEHPAFATSNVGVGEALLALGRPDEALAPIERAIAIFEAAGGDPAELAQVRLRQAEAWRATGRDSADALALARRVLDDLDPEDPGLAELRREAQQLVDRLQP